KYGQALVEWSEGEPEQDLIKKTIALARTGKIGEAKNGLLAAIKANPESTSYQATAALICFYLTKAQAAAFWQTIVDMKPVHADHALWNIAQRSDPVTADVLYRELLNKFPTSEHAPECAWWLFWKQFNDAKGDKTKLEAAARLAGSAASK